MWENVITFAINHGLMSVLFIGLMIYMLRDVEKREKKYVEIIEKLAERFRVVEEIAHSMSGVEREVRDVKIELKLLKKKVSLNEKDS